MYKVILSGVITGREKYREEFAAALVAARLRWHGAKVWNPAELPPDREYRWYMRMCCGVILNETDEQTVCVRIRGWHRSLGAVAEWALCRCLGISVVDQWW